MSFGALFRSSSLCARVINIFPNPFHLLQEPREYGRHTDLSPAVSSEHCPVSYPSVHSCVCSCNRIYVQIFNKYLLSTDVWAKVS